MAYTKMPNQGQAIAQLGRSGLGAILAGAAQQTQDLRTEVQVVSTVGLTPLPAGWIYVKSLCNPQVYRVKSNQNYAPGTFVVLGNQGGGVGTEFVVDNAPGQAGGADVSVSTSVTFGTFPVTAPPGPVFPLWAFYIDTISSPGHPIVRASIYGSDGNWISERGHVVDDALSGTFPTDACIINGDSLVSNGSVVYAANEDGGPAIHTFDPSTGALYVYAIPDLPSDGTIAGGPLYSNGFVYWLELPDPVEGEALVGTLLSPGPPIPLVLMRANARLTSASVTAIATYNLKAPSAYANAGTWAVGSVGMVLSIGAVTMVLELVNRNPGLTGPAGPVLVKVAHLPLAGTLTVDTGSLPDIATPYGNGLPLGTGSYKVPDASINSAGTLAAAYVGGFAVRSDSPSSPWVSPWPSGGAWSADLVIAPVAGPYGALPSASAAVSVPPVGSAYPGSTFGRPAQLYMQ